MQVFISYHRPDVATALAISQYVQGRLNCRVFVDLTAMAPGEVFPQRLADEVDRSSVLLALISHGLLTVDEARGQCPLDDPANWMRKEILLAAERNLRVVPILLEGARMPKASELPAALQGLVDRHAIDLRLGTFPQDLELIIGHLETFIETGIGVELKTLHPLKLLRDLVQYPLNFLKLLVTPKTVARAFLASSDSELVRSQVFLFISLAIFSVLMAPLYVDEPQFLMLLISQSFLLWVMAYTSSAILHQSWRWVGGTAPFKRILSLNSYYWAVSSVAGLGVVVAALGVIKTFEPALIPVLIAAMKGDLRPLLDYDVGGSLALRGAFWVVVGGNALLLLWTYAFWGAYREISGVSRMRSASAFIISSLLLLPMGLFFTAVEAGLMNVIQRGGR